MLLGIEKQFLSTLLLATLALNNTVAQVVSLDPSSKYQHQGQITAVDRANRLLTIEANFLNSDKAQPVLTRNTKTYKVAVGVKLKNMPKSQQYTGLKYLQPGTMVFFNLKRGTENLKNPSITEMRVELQ